MFSAQVKVTPFQRKSIPWDNNIKVFQNKMLRKICGSKRDAVRRQLWILHRKKIMFLAGQTVLLGPLTGSLIISH
jgi:hypothetical protein